MEVLMDPDPFVCRECKAGAACPCRAWQIRPEIDRHTKPYGACFAKSCGGGSSMLATAHHSYWHETAGFEVHSYAPLTQNIEVDVAILGGGITGLTAAAHLKAAGMRVAVLEAGEIGMGTTGYTTGHLDATSDLPLARLIVDFGQSQAAVVAQALREAIDQIEDRCRAWP